MNFRNAGLQDFIIKRITRRTIKKIYPDYYPKDVVSFFLKHHSDANILRDIKNNNVYLLEVDGKPGAPGVLVTMKSEGSSFCPNARGAAMEQ